MSAVAEDKELFADVIYNRYIMDAYSVKLCGNELRQSESTNLDVLQLQIQLKELCDCNENSK